MLFLPSFFFNVPAPTPLHPLSLHDALPICIRLNWRAPIASLNILVTSTCWRNDHNGFSHQGPGLIDVVDRKSTRLNSSHQIISYAVFCLKKKIVTLRPRSIAIEEDTITPYQ